MVQNDVRVMTARDIDDVVKLQVAFLDGSLVTDLGTTFLRSFHRAALEHPDTRAFVATFQGAVAGLAIGSLDVARFNAHVRPRIVPSLVAAIAAPRRWRLGLAIAKSLFEQKPQPPIPAELLLLVVDEGVRRHGLGRALLARLEAAFADAGVTRYRVAVRSHLAVARAFYARIGFDFEQELSVLGQPMVYLTKHVGR
ncbi:MAG TPA: GNAT family N-acetyltransferase [Vicinamibacterales bacterium]|nr:GNAT family N-acetyltransferase [Vicinamibacterales bacterium]